MIGRLIAVLALLFQTQTGIGTIAGRVSDSTGGVIPGVQVTAVQDVIGGRTYRAVTNLKGEYRLEAMTAGRYRVEVALAGFETSRKENIVVAADATTLDFTLMVSMKGWRSDDAVFAELLAFIEKTTGPSALNCGEIRLSRERREISGALLQEFVDCGFKSAAGRTPFRTIQQRQGIDSTIFGGFAGDKSGRMFEFHYDSAPCGNPGGCASSFKISACAVPGVRTEDNRSVLRCLSRD